MDISFATSFPPFLSLQSRRKIHYVNNILTITIARRKQFPAFVIYATINNFRGIENCIESNGAEGERFFCA